MIYLDTGCLVKLYYPEPESAKVAALLHGKPICFTPLHQLEFTNALAMKLFFKTANAAQVSSSHGLIATDLKNGVLVSIQGNWTNVFAEAVQLAAQYTPSIGCQSLDILHCAVAKILGANEFISNDNRQKSLATAMGLNLISL